MSLQPKHLAPIAVALSLILAGCSGSKAPPPQGSAVPVSVVTLTAAPLTLTRELPGRTSPFLVAEVRPQVSGIVLGRLFTEGG